MYNCIALIATNSLRFCPLTVCMTVTMRENTKRARKIKSHCHEVRTTQHTFLHFPDIQTQNQIRTAVYL